MRAAVEEVVEVGVQLLEPLLDVLKLAARPIDTPSRGSICPFSKDFDLGGRDEAAHDDEAVLVEGRLKSGVVETQRIPSWDRVFVR